MRNNSILVPLFKKIDKVLFGIEEVQEIKKPSEYMPSEDEEEFDVERSSN